MRGAQYIRDILSKKDYDFGRSDISLQNFHPQIYLALAAQGIFFGKRDSNLRFLIPLSSIAVTFVGVALESTNIYMGITTDDYSIACESFCYIVIIVTVIMVYSGILLNREKIYTLIEDMEKDIEQICSFGPRYREPFLAGQLLIWQCYVAWCGFMILSAVIFHSYPCVILLYQNLVATPDEHTTRPLVFPMWLPHDDPYRTPNYEMLYFLEAWYICAFILCFGGYVYTQFHFLLHNYILLDMIILDLQFIFEGLDESVALLPKNNPRRIAVQLALNKRLGRIVTWHSSVYRAIKTISSIFRPSLIYQLSLSSVAICLIVYQLALKNDRGEFDLLFTIMGIVAVLQLWIPCYLGTILRNKGFAVGDACWTCGWHETSLGRMIRTDIIMILLRAQMPIFIKYTGQPVLQLETFSAIMSTSYSYFNMLRQSASK